MSLQTTAITFDRDGSAIHHVSLPCTYKSEPVEATFLVWVKAGNITDVALAPNTPTGVWTAANRAQARWHVGMSMRSQQQSIMNRRFRDVR